jgi:hypothetical protein
VVIEMIVNEHRVAPAVHKAITEELPRTLRCMPGEKEKLRRQILESLKPFMRNVPDPDLAIYMMSVAAEAIIHNVTAVRPELLDNPRMAVELVTLFESFLCRPTEILV